jgi:DNA helicase II / ATP-dependent DNA helicase PcrA
VTIKICEKRKQIMDATGHVLVLGGPGSGKTTIALMKAVQLIRSGLKPGQKILFLSFSRAAVARIIEASKAEIAKQDRYRLSIQTFHSFCWEILNSHGYLVGCPKHRLEILLPHDEKAISGGLEPPKKGEEPTKEWNDWQKERYRLFCEDGKITFDLFAPFAADLLKRCSIIKSGIADLYPVIIVDEAQDTGPDAWHCIEILSDYTQVICLGDLSQQIFDYLEGVGPERVELIKNVLNPLLVDLEGENNRSPGTDIVVFANDIINNIVRGSPYIGISRHRYNPNEESAKYLRIALARTYKAIIKATGKKPESIAILAPSGSGVAHISAGLNNHEKPIIHKVLFDEADAMLAAQFAAFLLEPKNDSSLSQDIITSLEIFAALKRIGGSKTANEKSNTYLNWAKDVGKGKEVKTKLCQAIKAVLLKTRTLYFYGDPKKDWGQIRQLLWDSEQVEIKCLASNLQYIMAFNRGKRISTNLLDTWFIHGAYVRARESLKTALTEDQLFAGVDDLRGIHVMTIHKAKAKQFDGVIIFREGRRIDAKKWQSNLIWRDDPEPFLRSRKILRVGITRAKTHLLLLEPAFPNCPILSPYTL